MINLLSLAEIMLKYMALGLTVGLHDSGWLAVGMDGREDVFVPCYDLIAAIGSEQKVRFGENPVSSGMFDWAWSVNHPLLPEVFGDSQEFQDSEPDFLEEGEYWKELAKSLIKWSNSVYALAGDFRKTHDSTTEIAATDG